MQPRNPAAAVLKLTVRGWFAPSYNIHANIAKLQQCASGTIVSY